MLWTFASVFCNLHRLIQVRVPTTSVGSQSQFSLFLKFWVSLLLCSSLSSLMYLWRTFELLLFGCCWGLICGERNSLDHCVCPVGTYPSWSWCELIPFWVRLRKPQQNPNLNRISNMRLIYKSDWVQNLWRPWKHIVNVCVKFHLNRSPSGSDSHSRTKILATEISTR
jgi:hypothetical protein